MSDTQSQWPKLALYEDWEPIFGILKEAPGAPLQLVKPGTPPIYFGVLTDLGAFCRVFGLDQPKTFED